MESKIIKIQPEGEWSFKAAVTEAVRFIKSGGVVIHPTDTCYGVAADITKPEAIERVYQLKKRNYKKPLKIIVRDLEEFKKYGYYYPIIGKLIKKYYPYQIAFVVPRTDGLPFFLNPGDSTIGIQIPKDRLPRQLLKATDTPLVATSANISNEKECYNLIELFEQFNKGGLERLPLLILYSGELPRKRPSTVVKVVNNKKIKILRRGDAGLIKL